MTLPAPSRSSARPALFIGGGLLVAFAAFTLVSKTADIPELNRRTAIVAHWTAHGNLKSLFDTGALFGTPALSVVFTGLLAFFVSAKRGAVAGILVVVVMGLMTAAEALLRIRVDAIPWDQLPEFARHPQGWGLVHSSYPSGHVARIALLSGLAAAEFGANRRRVSYFCMAVLTVAVALQRIDPKGHTGADVVGGALLGWGCAALYVGAARTAGAMKLNDLWQCVRGRRHARGARP